MSMSPVVYGQDLDRLAGFYCATLGVTESRRTRSFVVLSGSSYDLVLVSMPPELAAQVTVTVPPQRRDRRQRPRPGGQRHPGASGRRLMRVALDETA